MTHLQESRSKRRATLIACSVAYSLQHFLPPAYATLFRMPLQRYEQPRLLKAQRFRSSFGSRPGDVTAWFWSVTRNKTPVAVYVCRSHVGHEKHLNPGSQETGRLHIMGLYLTQDEHAHTHTHTHTVMSILLLVETALPSMYSDADRWWYYLWECLHYATGGGWREGCAPCPNTTAAAFLLGRSGGLGAGRLPAVRVPLLPHNLPGGRSVPQPHLHRPHRHESADDKIWQLFSPTAARRFLGA